MPFESTPVLDVIIAGLLVPGTLITAMFVPFEIYPEFAYGVRATLNILIWSVVVQWWRNRMRSRREAKVAAPE
jgi:hypothetical protein